MINYVTIVVSRYKEDITWTEQFPLANVIIYNKGESLLSTESDKKYNEILLENVGREGHTYYKYIYDNYDHLQDYTIFLQGYPFDHFQNVVENVNKYINDTTLSIDFELLSSNIVGCNLSGCSYHGYLPLVSVYEQLFNERKTEMAFSFGMGGQFIVSKRQILKHPREFYLKIVEMLQHDINPIEGYVIERFHKLIFS
jgi:hypothetical protein